MQNTTQSYYPSHYNPDKYSTLESQILQLRKNFQNKNQNYPYSIELLRPSVLPKPEQYKEPRMKVSSSRQKIRQSSYEHEHTKTLHKMEKKIKQLLREVLYLAEIINENQISMVLSEKTQERLKVLDDAVLQQQYNKLKNKLYALKESPIPHKLHVTQLSHHRVRNPQQSIEKPLLKPKLQLKHTIDIKVPASSKNSSRSTERRSTHSIRHSDTNAKPEGHKLHFNLQQVDVLNRKIEHYRHKLNNAELTINQLVHNNQKISQLNGEINAQNMSLRSEILNYKYTRSY